MARDNRRVMTLVSVLTAFGLLATGCADSSGSPAALAPAPTATLGPQSATSNVGQVAVDGSITELAQVGGEITLDLAVTNSGPRDIQELTVVISDAYLAKLTVLDTSPSATRRNEQGGEYFIFGTLKSGQTQKYQIKMSPREAGVYIATVFLADMAPTDMRPLHKAGGGEAEFTDTTEVVPR